MIPSARFGVSLIEGEDQDEGKCWFNIGPVEEDGTVSEEYAVVVHRGDGNPDRKRSRAQLIAEALTEYAERHGLAAGFFYL